MTVQLTPEITEQRKPEYDINPLILSRWSPRAMTGEAIPHEELLALFEAAKWAPSSYNGQPWRFIYAERTNQAAWERLFNLMGDFNQSWTKNAAVIMVVISRTTFEHNGKPSVTHSFDTGAAWAMLALEANSRGLVAHGMQGFDYDKAKQDLHVPDDYTVEAMIAIGKRAPKDTLPADLQEMEVPSTRKALKDIVMEGEFKA